MINLERIFKRNHTALRAAPFLVGFIIFFIITATLTYIIVMNPQEGRVDNFLLSISASFIEDLVFFLLIGGIAAFISINNPAREKLEKRIDWFFNATRGDKDAIEYIKSSLDDLAIYSPRHDYEMSFIECEPKNPIALKVHVRTVRKLSNLFSDRPIKDHIQKYSVCPDFVSEHAEPNGVLISCFTGMGHKRKSVISFPEFIYNSPLKKAATISIDPDGETEFEHSYWMYFKIGEDFFIDSKYFTSLTKIFITNNCSHSITIFDNLKKIENVLTPGDNHPYDYPRSPKGRILPFKLLGVAK